MSSACDLVTLGESMVSFRTDGMLTPGGVCTAHVAGAESNVAIGLARLGHRARWVGGVADDELGDFVARTLTVEGVQVVAAPAPPGRAQGVMLLQRRTADATRVAYARAGSVGSRIDSRTALDALAGARRLHVTGITPALSQESAATISDVVAAARREGLQISLDVNYRARLWSREARAALTALVPSVDVVIASSDELDLLVTDQLGRGSSGRIHDGHRGAAEERESRVVARLAELGPTEIVVTRGADGASLYRDGRRIDAPSRAVTAVDVVGAGDAFTAGYLSGRLDGLDDVECLERGTVLGAFAVSTRGDWEGLPRRGELGLLDGWAPGDVAR